MIDLGAGSDNDGVTDLYEGDVDFAPSAGVSQTDEPDGVPNYLDLDSVGGTWLDAEEPYIDQDGDTRLNPYDDTSRSDGSKDWSLTDYELCDGIDNDQDFLIDEDDSDIGPGGCTPP